MDGNQHLPDKELLLRIASGDQIAFRFVYDKHWNRIYSTGLAITQSHHIAMDAVQDTFSILWKKRLELTSIENLEAYLYTMGRNRITALLRSQRIHEEIDMLNTRVEKEELSPERQVALRQFMDKIKEAIQLLPPKQAEVFTLSRLEELSYEEIAERLGISKDTVRNHLIKALGFMRIHFEGRKDDLLILWLVLENLF